MCIKLPQEYVDGRGWFLGQYVGTPFLHTDQENRVFRRKRHRNTLVPQGTLVHTYLIRYHSPDRQLGTVHMVPALGELDTVLRLRAFILPSLIY